MSEALAIPATTLVLKLLIEKRLQAAYGALAFPPVILAPPPMRAAPPSNGGAAPPPEAAGLYLYLHHLTPNPAWRNMYDPHIGSDGLRKGPAPAVMDLSYLVTAQGADLEREVLLGLAVNALTRNAIVPRPMITALLGGIAVPPNPTRIVDLLPKAGLDDPSVQPESLSISQSPFDFENSTKLWTALQSPLRPSAYFTVTTVFLTVDETFPAPPPADDVRMGVWPAPGPRSDLPPGERMDLQFVSQAPDGTIKIKVGP